MNLDYWLGRAAAAVEDWAAAFGPVSPHPSLAVSDERFGAAFTEFTARLAEN